MPVVVELPGGFTATLRTADEMNNKQVKELRRAGRQVGLVAQHLTELGLDDLRAEMEGDEDERTEEEKTESNKKALAMLTQLSDQEDDDLDLLQRVCTVIRLIEWTLDLPLPLVPEDVDLLPRPIYNALTTEAAKIDLSDNFGKDPESKIEAINDPKVLTTVSDG